MSRPHGALYSVNVANKKGFSQKIREAKLYFQWKRKYAARLKKYKDIHKGEDCFIIGNGPSLNKMDLAPLANYHTFGLNKIYMIFEKVDLNLSYLVCVNELAIEQCHEEFEKMYCPTFLSHTASDGIVKQEPHIERLHTLNVWSFYDDISQPICEGNTVTYVAMQIAYYMGFKRVFLVGVDHSFKQQGKPHETQVYEGDDENHFHPDYFKGMKWQLADVYGNEVSYHLANYHYKNDDRQILDATVGGKLEVFPKIRYEEAISIAKKKDN
ncbi:MAG: DUF115 domain-containing protein [Bacteroidetes bacterium]|nr:DUF115 domain-containing protein [Bacteroidota bacterium]